MSVHKGAVLVTGSSSGIGLETAIYLAERGYSVYAAVRDLSRRDQLDSQAARRNIQLNVVKIDTTDGASIGEAVGQIHRQAGGLYALINNAGCIMRGYFEDVSEREMRRVFDTNVFGTMAVTRAVLPIMREARRGRIIIMSSTGGRLASPGNSAYCSSKFALEGFGESLLQELVPLGIFVSLVEPGFIRTELFGRNRHVALQAAGPDSHYRAWFQSLEEMTNEQVRTATTPPSAVAKVVFQILEVDRPDLRYVVGRRARLLLGLRRYLPGEIFDRFWIREITRRVTGAKVT